jgi:hypothetical protein
MKANPDISKNDAYMIATANELEIVKKIKAMLRTRCIKEMNADPKLKLFYFTKKYTRLDASQIEMWHHDIQNDFKKKTPIEESNFKSLMKKGNYDPKDFWK